MEKSIIIIFINLLILFNIVSSQKTNRSLSIININKIQQNQQNQQCQIKTYSSKFTQCSINFKKCNKGQYQFQNCFQKQCSRYIRGIQCKLQIKIQLPQNQCYQKCCGSQLFSTFNCDKYNQFKQQKEQNWSGPFTLIFIIFSLIIIILILFFIIKRQNNVEKKTKIIKQKKTINWKTDLKIEVECDFCNKFGAILTTPCKHRFHIYCFQQNSNKINAPQCPKCHTLILKSIKISCRNCKNKSFKVKLQKIQQLSSLLEQAQTLHTDFCTSSTQSEQQFIFSRKS